MADFGVAAGQCVAVVWDKSSPAESLKGLVEELQALTGSEGRVSVENVDQLLQCKCLPGRWGGGGGPAPWSARLGRSPVTEFLSGWRGTFVAGPLLISVEMWWTQECS